MFPRLVPWAIFLQGLTAQCCQHPAIPWWLCVNLYLWDISHLFCTHHSPAPGWTLIVEKNSPPTKHIHLPSKALAFSISDDGFIKPHLWPLFNSLPLPLHLYSVFLCPNGSFWALLHPHSIPEFRSLQALWWQNHPTISGKLLHHPPWPIQAQSSGNVCGEINKWTNKCLLSYYCSQTMAVHPNKIMYASI